MNSDKTDKSKHAEREERILAYWKKKGIFEKTLKKKGKNFIFYEGPPTANGHPGIHHLEARAFKDAIPRYKTMQGFHVRRKGGWDTHGLPVELQVEKELGLKSKKEIEQYGLSKFNDKCKESVWRYVHEWEDFTNRMGYWVDLKDPYITYKPKYIESLWNIIQKTEEKNLLYKDYKVVPWCPRCGTGLSSHELAQGYQDIKDLSVYVKFKVTNPEKIGLSGNVYLLAWTTTPWTLPGNVALAVGEEVEYVMSNVKIQMTNEIQSSKEEVLIFAKERLNSLKDKGEFEVVSGKGWKGKELVGLEYEPLYPYLKDNIQGEEKEKVKSAYKVYPADFVTTADGTGIVHTAVMYGQDDFELGTKIGLPKYHLVNEDGTFKKEAGSLAGLFVKDEGTDVAIIKDLASRNLLFAKEKYEHSYPFCWRCKTPLIYFARDSWYIKMSVLRDKLVANNQKINWEPEHIKAGRFGEWLAEVKDWAISRERYWGTPLPVWTCNKCNQRKVVGSLEELEQKSKNNYFVMRHGEAVNNTSGIINSDPNKDIDLTKKGKNQVLKAVNKLKNKEIDLVFVSPFKRTFETSNLLKEKLNWSSDMVKIDQRIGELNVGVWEGRKVSDFIQEFKHEERFERGPENGETYADIKKRMGDFIYDLETKYSGKNILIISHETPLFLLIASCLGLDRKEALELRGTKEFIGNAEVLGIDLKILPKNDEYELDLHRPYVDQVILPCKCGGEMKRVKEVMDVWFDSGAMPFAQDHYPFENKDYIDRKGGFPADFISEAIDQTRGWFYTLHAIGAILGKGNVYKNVVCLGHLLDKDGKKMSKSIGNVVNPWEVMEKYGADATRFWMYSINQPGESKNFDEKTVDEIVKKVFNLTLNVLAFYLMYKSNSKVKASDKSKNVLDRWIITCLSRLNKTVSDGLDHYKFFEPTRAIRDFVADLSQWYLRRSRDRFKSNSKDKDRALSTTAFVLLNFAKIIAPFTPFFAEDIYEQVGGGKESVHLETWPKISKIDNKLLELMGVVRSLSSKGLEARMNAKINVRQPLQSIKIKNKELFNKLKKFDKGSLINVIKDELNVKEVLFDESIEAEITLDTNITPELKEEGMVREFIRIIQDLRKEKGLTIKDKIILKVDTDDKGKEFIQKNISVISKSTGLKTLKYLEIKIEKVDFGEFKAGFDC